MREGAPRRRTIRPTPHPPALTIFSCFLEMSLCFPIYSHHRPPGILLAGIPCQPALCRSAPAPCARYQWALLQLSHPAQPLAGESDACIMENVSGERAVHLRNLTNIRLATLGLSLHPRHRLGEP